MNSNTIIALTNDNFDATINSNDIVVIDFWAQWCAPCLAFTPIYETVANDYPTLVFAKINVEAEPDLAQEFQIRSIPTIMIFRQQIIVYAEAGSLSREALIDLIEQAKSLDMDEVLAALKESTSTSD